MKTILKFAAVVMFGVVSFAASAATYYPSMEICKAVYSADKATQYQPTAKSKQYGPARITGLEKRPLEGDACVYMVTQPGKRWVFLKQGTLVYTKGPNVKFLEECQNDILEVVYMKKDSPVVPTRVETPPVKAAEVIPPAVIPPVVAPPAPVCSPNCVPTLSAKKEREEVSPSGLCGIAVVSGKNTSLIVDKLVVKEFEGKIQISRVPEFTKEAVPTSVKLFPKAIATGSCDGDKKMIRASWAQIVKAFSLPVDCLPAKT